MSTLITNPKLRSRTFALFLALCLLSACASLPEKKVVRYKPPEKDFFVELPTGELATRQYKTLGWVKSRAVFSTMDAEHEIADEALCKNYYNKAAADLVKEAKKAGADAVIKARSVVFLLDGRTEEYPTPQCSDDGAQGEILMKGIAVKWEPLKK